MSLEWTNIAQNCLIIVHPELKLCQEAKDMSLTMQAENPWSIPMNPQLHESVYHPNARLLMSVLGRVEGHIRSLCHMVAGLTLQKSRLHNS